MLSDGKRLDRPQGELEQPQRRLPLHRAEPFRGFGDRAGRGVTGVVTEEALAVQLDGLHLADRVQGTADPLRRSRELQIDVAERLQPGPEARGGAAYPPGHRAQPAMPAGQQRDDPVRLAEFLHAQHHRVVAVELAAVSGGHDAHCACPAPPLPTAHRRPETPTLTADLRVISGMSP